MIKKMKKENSIKGMKSITTKITLTLFILCFIALLATGVIIGTTVNDNFTQNEKEILNETTKSVSNEAEVFFARYIAIVEQMAQDKNLQNFLINAEGRETLLETEGFMTAAKTVEDTQKMDPEVILSAYIAEAGYYLVSPTVYSKVEYDVSSKDYYKAVSENRICITDPYVDAITGGVVITISGPVTVNNKIVGLAAVDIAIDDLTEMVGNYKLGETGYFTLLTENNIIASHKDEDSLLKSITDINLSGNIIELVNSRTGDVAEYTYNDETYEGNSVQIGDTGWQILSSLPKDEFMANTKQVIITIIIIFLIVLVLLLVVMIILIRRMTRPIKKITNITNKLSAGELDVDIDVRSKDEIGELAKSIESLTMRLKSYITYIGESVSVLNELAQGNLVMNFQNDYDGEFAKLKN
ncbi:MAG: cache domain-containing protein, partial [Sedimentibacter sp.]|uniref:HAMP domain-containing protein n=1 Tax=Sedimentibacter sp. TaxID=1960295 RepID=UPI002980B296